MFSLRTNMESNSEDWVKSSAITKRLGFTDLATYRR